MRIAREPLAGGEENEAEPPANDALRADGRALQLGDALSGEVTPELWMDQHRDQLLNVCYLYVELLRVER